MVEQIGYAPCLFAELGVAKFGDWRAVKFPAYPARIRGRDDAATGEVVQK